MRRCGDLSSREFEDAVRKPRHSQARNGRRTMRVLTRQDFEDIMRSALLWLIGIPIPIIIILWLVTGHA